MKCISCGAGVPDGAHFCPACGVNQGFPGAPGPALQEPEKPVWKGRYSPLADGGAWILWALFAAVAAYAAFKWLTFPEPWTKWVYWGAVLLPAAVIGLRCLFRRISVSYRLTTHRLFTEIGIISRRITEVELLRVDDLSVTQNIIQRIFDVGVVTLQTTDASEPELKLLGISQPIEVKEQIRTHVQKRRGRTVNLESL
jgi:uncharacterized membrane protein YdbT with pleckstrin-like domain